MNQVEDRLRALTRALEDTFPDSGVPPLSLPPAGEQRRRWFREHRARGWLIPLSAAAAVIAIVAGSLVLTHSMGTAAPHRSGRTPASGLVSEIPPFYVVLTNHPGNIRESIGDGAYAVILSSRTGRVLGKVAAPAPWKTFTMVAGAGDGDTFALGASTQWLATGPPTHFYLLRFRPGDDSLQLTALPSLTTRYVTGLALSADASKLAVAHEPRGPVLHITVYNVATGASRSWTGPSRNFSFPDNFLSWSADGRLLGFDYQDNATEHPKQYAGVLDTTAPGTTLPTASVIPPITPDQAELLTPNGELMVGVGGPTADGGVAEYSVATHHPAHGLGPVPAIGHWHGGWLYLRWVDTTGDVVIAVDGGRTCALGHGQAWCLPVSSIPDEFVDPLGVAW